MRPLLQPGNEVNVDWKGRDDSLGHFALEMISARAANAMDDSLSLAALAAVCAVALAVLPEREAHNRAYQGMVVILDNLDDLELWPALMARWELGVLAELGFGLTLDRCAATGAKDDLIYISPRSACAVSREAGKPYRNKLLPLPEFLKDAAAPASLEDALDGLKTTGHFIETRILHVSDKSLPDARQRIISPLTARAQNLA